jgi:hypothetical protein
MLARRSIQSLIDGASYLNPEQIDRFVQHLNRNNRDSIDAEWELVILTALASFGTVQHEPDLGGTARLDVRFQSPLVTFVADVRAVSDETYDRENPVDHLRQELARYAAQLSGEGFQGGFNFNVGGQYGNARKRPYKTKLVLPQPHEFRQYIFNAGFHAFLNAIRSDPLQARHHVANNDRASVSMVWIPGPGGMRSVTHPAYKVAHDTEHNVIYKALRDKSDQIKRVGDRDPDELAGIILCDGGCDLLRMVSGVGTVSLDQIVKAFLRRTRTVTFVFVVDTHYRSWGPGSRKLAFEARFWAKQRTKALETLRDKVSEALQGLPVPVRSGLNTMNHYEWATGSDKRLYSDYKGDVSMSSHSVEISLRATIEYLAGRIDRTEYEHAVPTDWLAQLRRSLDLGKRVSSVSITKHPDRDDDGLVVTFGEPDPAMSPFRAPTRKDST